MRRSAGIFVAFASAFAFSVAGCPLKPFDLPPEPMETTGGAGACQADSACDDKNPCTIDRCLAEACVFDPEEAGISCGDADLCNGGEICDGAGACAAGDPVAADDSDVCTVDACDPATGAVTHSAVAGCVAWSATPIEGAPDARERHTAVWTGSKMIIWGGSGAGGKTATGGVFDPALKTWTATSMTGAPSPRHLHSAAWTGSRMIVWGGYGVSDYEIDGGIYDPEVDTWEALPTAGAPSKRTVQAEVWTGEELFVWGGLVNGSTIASGATFDVKTSMWSPIPSAGAPGDRHNHTAVWAGDRVIVWGGSNLFDWLNDGAMFMNGAWIGATSGINAPEYREGHTAVWTGSEMIVWGGFNGGNSLNTGGMFDPKEPAASAWVATSTEGAPAAREEHTAVWTGEAMMVWGGCGDDGCTTTLGDGGVFTPSAEGGSWEAVGEHPALEGRRGHTAVWTGEEVIVWGGRVGKLPTNTGAQAKLP
jgi:hypothetical protein